MFDLSQTSYACDFEVNQTERYIKDGCQSGRKVISHNSKSDLPLDVFYILENVKVVDIKNADTKKYVLLPMGRWLRAARSLLLLKCLAFFQKLQNI